MKAAVSGQEPKGDHQPAEELDDSSQAELGQERHLWAAKQAEQLLRAVAGEEQADDNSHHGIELRSKASEHTFHLSPPLVRIDQRYRRSRVSKSTKSRGGDASRSRGRPSTG